MKQDAYHVYFKRNFQFKELFGDEHTQATIAARTGICQSYLSRLLNGRQPMQFWWVIRVIKEFGLEIGDIMKEVVVRR